jgi:hypothetical protein
MQKIDSTQTGQDLLGMIEAIKEEIQRPLIRSSIPQQDMDSLERLLALGQTIVNDPIKWPALVSWFNDLDSNKAKKAP